ncbi:TnpV protein [Pseudoflavonifractor sp. 524-17]|uniref:TnpV protein n=1 Tax=Pseudoflavonifractor sp. 524-17 TaxID=2304577 RepID=UPI0013796E28|nr:TnpV protein [Pseudoflavonifractor sp. 524-17]NCE66273.1 TnpV protein [Pseudoflavonifractor sp. 524-17]
MSDYEIPAIGFSEAATENLGKYGRMRKQYLQAHRSGLYNSLLLSGTLYTHLLEIDQTARKRLDLMMPEMAKAAGATKELKAHAPLRLAGLMNTCKAQVEEIILNELIWD